MTETPNVKTRHRSRAVFHPSKGPITAEQNVKTRHRSRAVFHPSKGPITAEQRRKWNEEDKKERDKYIEMVALHQVREEYKRRYELSINRLFKYSYDKTLTLSLKPSAVDKLLEYAKGGAKKLDQKVASYKPQNKNKQVDTTNPGSNSSNVRGGKKFVGAVEDTYRELAIAADAGSRVGQSIKSVTTRSIKSVTTRSIDLAKEILRQVLLKVLKPLASFVQGSLMTFVSEFLALLKAQGIIEFLAGQLALIVQGVPELLSDALPFVAEAVEAVKGVGNLTLAAYHQVQAVSLLVKSYSSDFSGTAQGAIRAVSLLFSKGSLESLMNGVRQISASGIRIGLIASVVAAPAIWIVAFVNCFLKFFQEICSLAVEYLSVWLGNLLLRGSKTLDTSVFTVSPLLGCYALVFIPSAELIAFTSKDIDEFADWVHNKAEKQVREIDTVRWQALAFMDKSRFCIPELYGKTGKKIHVIKTLPARGLFGALITTIQKREMLLKKKREPTRLAEQALKSAKHTFSRQIETSEQAAKRLAKEEKYMGIGNPNMGAAVSGWR